MFRHPKYYKELRKRNKLAESRQPVVGGQQQSDQAISKEPATAGNQRSPGQGLKVSSTKLQASSTKHQAFEPTRSIAKRQASQPE
jgi:hypothetical protein